MKELISQKQQKVSKLILDGIEGLNYSSVMKLLRNKEVKVNGKRINKEQTINVGDVVAVYLSSTPKAFSKVIFEDANILVVDKNKNFTSETLFDNLKAEYGELYFIHRLDRNTDGVIIFAKNSVAEKELLFGFKHHIFIKEYLALCAGVMPQNSAILTAYLIKDSTTSTVKIFDKKVKDSVEIKTGYTVVNQFEDTALLSVTLYTGKTHQIRAHLAHIGHPIVGDSKYGSQEINVKFKSKRQELCAKKLTLYFAKTSPLYYLNGTSFIKEN